MTAKARYSDAVPKGPDAGAAPELRQADANGRVGLRLIGMRKAASDEVRAGLAQHLARLRRYGLVLTRARDAADDLVQATCLRALERSAQYEPGSRLDRWLFAILHSIWLNDLRASRTRQGRGWIDAETTLAFDGVGQMEATVLTRQVLEQISGLPEAQRETLLLVYGEGLSYREAAEILEVPVGTVQSRLAAARLTLAAGRGGATDEGTRP